MIAEQGFGEVYFVHGTRTERCGVIARILSRGFDKREVAIVRKGL